MNIEDSHTYAKTGYLNSNIKFFHLIESEPKEFNFHYHDFHKVLIFISGNVSYQVEGKTYQLNPYDIVLVNVGEIHKPIIHDKSRYERIIIYISADFFKEYKNENYDLLHCFSKAIEHHSSLIRIKDILKTILYTTILELRKTFQSTEYAYQLYQQVLFTEFLIWVNRAVINEGIIYPDATIANKTVLDIMNHINAHLCDDISINSISNYFFLNRSYLMHLFKSETGYTIGTYISEKRLFISRKLIQNGMSIMEACFQSGFKNYTTFYRAFVKKFNMPPKAATIII